MNILYKLHGFLVSEFHKLQIIEFIWSSDLCVRLSWSSHIRFESHICLSYLELSDKTMSKHAREISNTRHRVYYIQRQMCTSLSSKVEHEWHLFFFMVFLPYWGQVFHAVKDGDNPDRAPERPGTPRSDSIAPQLDSTPHWTTSAGCIPPAFR